MGSQTYHCNKNSIIQRIALILKLYCPIRARALQAGLLLCWSKRIGCFSDPLELRFTLEVEKDCRLFNVAALKYTLDDFIAVKRLACSCKNIGNDIGNSTLREAPVVECIDDTSDQNEELVFDKIIVNRLCGKIFSIEVNLINRFSDV